MGTETSVEVELGEAGRNWERPPPPPLAPRTQDLGARIAFGASRGSTCRAKADATCIVVCDRPYSLHFLIQQSGSLPEPLISGGDCLLATRTYADAVLVLQCSSSWSWTTLCWKFPFEKRPQHHSVKLIRTVFRVTVFQQLELDYAMGPPHPLARTDLGVTPIIRMFGVTEAGAHGSMFEVLCSTLCMSSDGPGCPAHSPHVWRHRGRCASGCMPCKFHVADAMRQPRCWHGCAVALLPRPAGSPACRKNTKTEIR